MAYRVSSLPVLGISTKESAVPFSSYAPPSLSVMRKAKVVLF